MIFAAILAGGTGTRMGNSEIPKQFLDLGDRPIIVHTVEKFAINESFEKIVILTPKSFIRHTENLMEKYLPDNDRIAVVEGGQTRNETVMKSISYIKENFEVDDSSVIVTHDSVRPFVTHRIIEDNIEAAKKYGACDTVIPATDTIVESTDGDKISKIPLRDHCYQGQTPQSFKITKLEELFLKLGEDEVETLTDAAKIFVLNDEDVYLVDGDVSNIKITYPYDLKLANTILREK